MSDFLCPFPWISPCVTTDGHFRVCPVSQSAPSQGYVKNKDGKKPHIGHITSINEMLNSDSLKSLRKRMMAGQDISETCQRCIHEENRGLRSRRILELERLPEFTKNLVEKVTRNDGSITEESPVSSVVIRLGNKCNLACRMCGPSSSSAWYAEWKDTNFSGFKEDGNRVALVSEDSGKITASPNPYAWAETDSVARFVKQCGPSLARIHFSGGEPLLSKGHLQTLHQLAQSSMSSQISLEYNSNLTVLSDEILELWPHFKSIEIGISIDGPPEINEYIRYPLKSGPLFSNLKKLENSKIHGRFWIATTVQIYNLFYLNELEDWVENQKFTKISPQISWHVLRAPKELSIYALPDEVKRSAAHVLRTSKTFSPLADLIFDLDYSENFQKFIDSTRAMDSYRGQSIKQLQKLWSFVEEDSLC